MPTRRPGHTIQEEGVVDVLTLIVAILGLVLAVVSLAWQIAQHQLAGPRVRVRLLWGCMGNGRVATGPVEGTLDAFRHSGISHPVFVMAVEGRNVGRMPIDVTGFGVELNGFISYSLAGWQHNPALPHRLEPGSEVTFYVPLEDIQRAVDLSGGRYRGQLRGQLKLAIGTSPTSDWSVYPPT